MKTASKKKPAKKTLFTTRQINAIVSPALTPEQIKIIARPTPHNETELRTDDEGFEYRSVKGSYIKNQLNLIFGFNWNFEIKSREYFAPSSEVLIEGRLTIRNEGFELVREQFGKYVIKNVTKTTGNKTYSYPFDIGNAFKSAATDALKKCASEFGICWDIYNQEKPEPEVVIPVGAEESQDEKKITERLSHFLALQKDIEGIERVVATFFEHEEKNPIREALIQAFKDKVSIQ